jgi:hypothetical protein
MDKNDLKKLGSDTAKGGFKNEDDIVLKFNSWGKDEDAKKWLIIMGYPIDEIEKVEAIKLHGYKTDVQVQITIYMKKAIAAENLSVKLVSNPQGFNQVDKRWVDKYVELWSIPEDISIILKMFTGELPPREIKDPRDKRRMFFDEMDEDEQDKILKFFSKNKFLIISDTLKGRGIFSAGWMMVALKTEKESKWVLKSINQAINVFGQGDVKITSRGSLIIGRIKMQRKGGDAGRPTAGMLQFKINPVDLFSA